MSSFQNLFILNIYLLLILVCLVSSWQLFQPKIFSIHNIFDSKIQVESPSYRYDQTHRFFNSMIKNHKIVTKLIVSALTSLSLGPIYPSFAQDSFIIQESISIPLSILESPIYSKGILNFYPSDDFWYPPYMIGRWKTKLTFGGVLFDEKLGEKELELAATSGAIPGFQKYSVFLLPNIGKDVECTLRYVQIDSHPREDHPFNLRQLVTSFEPSIVIDQAPYGFQLSTNWFDIPSNHWDIRYHDNQGVGKVHIETQKRDIMITAGTIETVEIVEQTQERINQDGSRVNKKDDYALYWKLQVPEAIRDEFITLENLRQAKNLVGTLDVLVYLQPTTDLYLKIPGRPVGVFQYKVDMERIVESEEVQKTEYPYVPKEDGPVELDQFFGY